MTTGYETDMPKDMPDDAYAGLSIAHLNEWLAQKALEQSDPVETEDEKAPVGYPEDPTSPAA